MSEISTANFQSHLENLRNRFTSVNGTCSPAWEAVLATDPEFFEACIDMQGAPVKLEALEPKIIDLLHVAINVSCLHLNADAVRTHIRSALRHGATPDEIGETIQLASVLGIHSINIGIPLMLDEARQAGAAPPAAAPETEDRRRKLKETFMARRGYWSPLWDDILTLSPDFFESYANYSSLPWQKRNLSAKTKEFIYIAIDIVTHHLFEPGTRVHIANALKHGASVIEITQVIETVSLIGLQSAPLGYVILQEQLAEFLVEQNSN